MKSIFRFLIILSLGVFVQNSFAQEASIIESGLFQDALPPAPGPTPFPENSGFITINPNVFNGANAHSPEIFTIDNFPLGSERVTLHVEQFDVIRKDSKLVLGTKNGDVPTAVPAHVLLHGSVEGKGNSHVYLAVFDGYALGYIDASPDDRYLVQPVSLSSDAASTMIVYKQNDVARTIPEGEKWKCGSEEYPPNFQNIQKITTEMASSSHEPEIQSAKTVKLLSIAIDCDFGFYQKNGSDKTKAQNYAIAVLGAHSDIYVRDLNCGVTAGYLRVWTTQDTYSDDGDSTQFILPRFIDYWNSNMGNVTYAAAMLYETHQTGGLAYVGQMCNVSGADLEYGVCGLNTGYTFPKDGYIWDVDVSSHEFGHICGSLHTHNCFWNPPIDSCYPSEGGCFGATVTRKGTIMSYCHLTSAGTELKFHPRVATFLKNRFNSGSITPCAATVTVPSASAGPNKSFCSGSSVSIGASATGGTSPLTYSWRPAAGLSATNTAVVNANPTKTTTYYITVTDANMLRSYDTVTVTLQKPTVPTITANKDSIFSSTASSYQWYLGTTLLPGATNQKYVPTQSGSYVVRTTSANGCDTVSKPFAFTLIVEGVNDASKQYPVRLYPNPASGQITFDYSAAGDVALELSISDILGNTVYHSSRQAGENSSPLSIDIRSFAQGTYYVRYSFGRAFSTLKFVRE